MSHISMGHVTHINESCHTGDGRVGRDQSRHGYVSQLFQVCVCIRGHACVRIRIYMHGNLRGLHHTYIHICVCIYIYIKYIYIYIYIYAYIYQYIRIHIFSSIYIYTCVYAYIYIQIDMYSTYMHTYICIFIIHTYICLNIYINYTCRCIYIYVTIY